MDDKFDEIFDQQFEKALMHSVDRREASRSKKKQAYIKRQREQGHLQLWNDYFSEDATYPSHMFRRRFRMNKPLFMRIVDRLSDEIPYFQQRRDATGRFGHSTLQKATAAIRMMAYGCPADAVDKDERDGYTQFDVSVFAQPDSSQSSQVDFTYSTDMPSNLGNMMSIRNRVRDRTIYQQLKADLVKNIWQKFGINQDFN